MEDLAIISTYFNPLDYNSRKKNTDAFLRYIEESGVSDHLYIAEITYPNQELFIKHKNTIYLKCESPVWNKEAALNAIVKRLPPHYTKVMWVDLDVMWTKENWYNGISKLLDSYKIVQPFSKCIYLNNDSSISKIGVGYFNTVKNNISEDRVCYGMTMAYTREFCDKFGFFDKFLLGAGDTILAMPAAGQIEDFISFSRGFCFDDVWDDALKYAENISNYVNGNYTFYDEEITHLFHGALDFRKSYGKKEIIKKFKNMKFADLYEKNSNELYEITKSNIDFLNTCNDFFKRRNEDFIPFITIQNSQYGVECRDGYSFLWMPPRFKIKIDIACKARFYFTRGGNKYSTKHLNFCRQSDNKMIRRDFDNQGLLLIELDVIAPEEISFSSDYFIPSQIYEHSDDNRELSCILKKVEMFEEYPLQGL